MSIVWIIRQYIKDLFATEEMLYGDWFDKKGKLTAHFDKDKVTVASSEIPLKWKLIKRGRRLQVWSDGLDYSIVDFSVKKDKLFLYFRESGEALVLFRAEGENKNA